MADSQGESDDDTQELLLAAALRVGQNNNKVVERLLLEISPAEEELLQGMSFSLLTTAGAQEPAGERPWSVRTLPGTKFYECVVARLC